MDPFYEQAIHNLPKLAAIRQFIHRYPELSWQEYRTTRFIRRLLTRLGLTLLPWPHPTGVLAELRGRHPGPVAALRADIDALPIQERNSVGYISRRQGMMHACGHDAHTACLLGAACLLTGRAEELTGSVRFIFQPAEETGGGAMSVVKSGVLAGVNAIFGLHNQPEPPVGSIGIKDGALMAANIPFYLNITGVEGHGAMPHKARDPILAAADIIQALQAVVSRFTDPAEPLVLSIGKIHGGTARNVIPPCVEMEGTIRLTNTQIVNDLLKTIKRVVHCTALAMGTKAEINFLQGFPPVVNPPELADFCRRSLGGIFGEGKILASHPTMATEDFSQYQQQVPGIFLWLGSGNRDHGIIHPWHHAQFNIDEKMLAYGAAALARLAYDHNASV
ncbi:M20 metallopeptidase family protein [Acetonema longum]|uniref:Thermostable carboxypeptidase 1 n=1 Tax=Acetonema longum DSM 6540 TaxID=1009370 RepID=F7NQ07_9FIRM|nr:M20 family metallopeptidase [Acetonema longum]EGO61884.1 thermostable carboxypeptidase 1 [Acetonema longum DSM 6540]